MTVVYDVKFDLGVLKLLLLVLRNYLWYLKLLVETGRQIVCVIGDVSVTVVTVSV